MVCERTLRILKKFSSSFTVSLYLVVVGCFLLFTRRIHINPSKFAREAGYALLRSFRRPFCAELADVTHEKGHAWVAPLPRRLISDRDGLSRLILFEDSQELPHPHSAHDDIRNLGAGRYSHWADAVFFSSSDNTDPSANGRRYTVREV
jgi:hypothetical protein